MNSITRDDAVKIIAFVIIGIALGFIIHAMWPDSPAPTPYPRPQNTSVVPRPPASVRLPAPALAPPVYYPNCDAVRAAGQAPLYRDSPGYRPDLDHNGDGVACQ